MFSFTSLHVRPDKKAFHVTSHVKVSRGAIETLLC